MLFDSDPRSTPPEANASDYAQSVAKLGLATLTVYEPHLAPLLVAWDQLSGMILNRRVSGFFQSVVGEIDRYVKRPESLFQNDQFVSALLQTMHSAAKAHQQEKLDALRNAAVNVALGTEPDEDRQAVFLSLVERFTPLHISLLRFFEDPASYCRRHGKNPAPERDRQPVYLLILDCVEGIAARAQSPHGDDRPGSQPQFVNILVTDLAQAALVPPDLNDAYKQPPRFPKWVTHLGEDFLEFITKPKAKEHESDRDE